MLGHVADARKWEKGKDMMNGEMAVG